MQYGSQPTIKQYSNFDVHKRQSDSSFEIDMKPALEYQYFNKNMADAQLQEQARAHSSMGLSHPQQAASNDIYMGRQMGHLRTGQAYQNRQFAGSMNQHKKSSLTGQKFFSTKMGTSQDSNKFEMMSYQAQVQQMFQSNPTMLIHQHNQCKVDNRERLKGVQNLDDLINFRVKTVADHIQDDQNAQLHNWPEKGSISSQNKQSITVLKKICDPLLANRQYPKLLQNKQGNFRGQSLQPQQTSQKLDLEKRYEIPADLKVLNRGYSVLNNPLSRQSMPKITKQETMMSSMVGDNIAPQSDEGSDGKPILERNETSDSFKVKRDKFEKEQYELSVTSANMKLKHRASIKAQDDRLQMKANEKHIDPVKMLRSYFNNKTVGKKGSDDEDDDNSIVHGSQEISQKSVNPNYIIAKYKKMKNQGKLAKIDKQIEERSTHQHMMEQYNSYLQFQSLNDQLTAQNLEHLNKIQTQAAQNNTSNPVAINDNHFAHMRQELSNIFNQEMQMEDATITNDHLFTETNRLKHVSEDITAEYNQNIYLADGKTNSKLQKSLQMSNQNVVGKMLGSALVESESGLSKIQNAYKSQEEIVESKLIGILNDESSLQPSDAGNPRKTSQGLKFSELLKYQNVRNCGQNKSYVKYTQEQIDLAQKLKHLETKHQEEAKKKLNKDHNDCSSRPLLDELRKKNKSMRKTVRNNHGQFGFNINGSLPHIKNELERQTDQRVKEQAPQKKVFKEDAIAMDNKSLQQYDDHQRYETAATPLQDKRYRQNPYVPISTNSRMKPRDNAATVGNRSAMDTYSTRKASTKSGGQKTAMQTDYTSYQARGNYMGDTFQISKIAPASRAQNSFRARTFTQDKVNSTRRSDSVNNDLRTSKATDRVIQDVDSNYDHFQQSGNDYPQVKVVDQRIWAKVEGHGNTIGNEPQSFNKDLNISGVGEIMDIKTVQSPSTALIANEKAPITSESTGQKANNLKRASKIVVTKDAQIMERRDDNDQTAEKQVEQYASKELINIQSKTLESRELIAQDLKAVDTADKKSKDYNDPKSLPGSRGAARSGVGRVSIYSSKQTGKVQPKPQQSLAETEQRSSTHGFEESPQLPDTNVQMRDNVLIEIQNDKQDMVAVGGATVVDAPRAADPEINTMLETDTQRRSHELTSLNNSPQGTTSKYSKFLKKSALKDASPQQPHPFSLIDIAQSMNSHTYQEASKRENRNISLLNTQKNDRQSSKGSTKKYVRASSGERALSLPSQINIKQYVQQKLMEKTPIITDADERGYHSSTDPHMDNVSSEMFDQVLNDHLIRRGCWLPSRFKKFPRFTIFTQKDEMQDKRHLIDQYISLNPQVLALLAASDTYNIGQIASVLEEPAVTNRSTTVVSKLVGMGQNQDFMTTHNTMPFVQNSFEQDYSQLKSGKKQGTEFLTEQSPLKGPTDAKHVPTSPSQFQTQMDPAEMTDKKPLEQQAPFVQDQNANDLVEIFHSNKNAMAATPDYLKYSFGNNFPIQQQQMKMENVQQSQIKQFDPFDRVLLTKGIDNQILTSFRTLNKSNNMISNTLKVVHQRFQPQSSKAVPSKGPRSKQLYQIDEEGANADTINERIFEQYQLTQQDKEDIIRLSLGVKSQQELNVHVMKKLDLMQRDGVWPNINVEDQTQRRDNLSALNTGSRLAERGGDLQRCSTSKTDTRLLASRAGDSIDKKAVKDGLVTVTTKAKGKHEGPVNGTSYASSVAKKARMQQLPTVAMAQYDLGAGEELHSNTGQPYLLDNTPQRVLNEKQQQQFNEIEAFSRENKINITAKDMNLPTFQQSPRQPSTMVIKADVSNVLKKMDAGSSPTRHRNGENVYTSKTLTKEADVVKTDNRRTEPTFGPQEVYEGTVSIPKSLMPTPTMAQRVRTDRQAVKDYNDPEKPATDHGVSDLDASEKDQSRVQTFYGSDATRMRANTKTARSKGEDLVIKPPDASVKFVPKIKKDQHSQNTSQGHINVKMGPNGARLSQDGFESWGPNATQSKGSLLANNYQQAASMKQVLPMNGDHRDSKQNTGFDQRDSLADSMQITRKSLIKLEDGAIVKESSGKTSQIMNQDLLPAYTVPIAKKNGGKFGAGGFRGPKVKPQPQQQQKVIIQKPMPRKRASIERNSEAVQAATQSKEELMELVRRNNTGSEIDNLILTLANDTHRSGASPISTTKAALVGGGIMTPEDRSLAQFSKDQSKMDTNRNKNTTEAMVEQIYARNFQNDYPVKLRRIIDEIYQKETKMKKKVMERKDMQFTNDFLFDLSKVRPMEGLTTMVESEPHNPYPVHVEQSQIMKRVQEKEYRRPTQKSAAQKARVLENLEKERKKIEDLEVGTNTGLNSIDPFTNRDLSESQNTQGAFYVLNTRNPPLAGGRAQFVSSKFNNNLSNGSTNREYKFMSQQRDRDRTTRNPGSGTRGVSVGSQGDHGHGSANNSTPERRPEHVTLAQTAQISNSKVTASDVKAGLIDQMVMAPEIADIGQDFIQGLSIQIKNESLPNTIQKDE